MLSSNPSAPRPNLPQLPEDPEQQAWVAYQRLESRARSSVTKNHPFNEAVRILAFLGNGAPHEPDIPEDASPLKRAAAEARAWSRWAPLADRSAGFTLLQGWEQTLVVLMERYPSIDWEVVVEWLSTPQPPYPSEPVGRALSWEEELLFEETLAADVTAHTDYTGDTRGLRHHLADEGLDWQAVLDAQEPGSLDAIPFTTENLSALEERGEWYREQADDIAHDLMLTDPEEDPREDYVLSQVLAVRDAYERAVEALSAGQEPPAAPRAMRPVQSVSERPGGGQEATEPTEIPELPVESAGKDIGTAGQPNQQPQPTPEVLVSKLAEANPEQKEWMTVPEVAAILDVKPATVRRHLRDEKIPATKVGSQYRISRTALDAWLAEGGSKPEPEPAPTYRSERGFNIRF